MFAGSLPKEAAFPDDNEDLVAVSDDFRRVVVCDGASESFDSKTWARVVQESFMDSIQINKQWIEAALADYHSKFDFPSMNWSRQAAFERGSYTTLLGIDFSEGDRLAMVTAIGDSVAFLLSGGNMEKSFPYNSAEQFHERPLLLSTKGSANSFDLESGLAGLLKTEWRTDQGVDVAILCMTDALGQWALKGQEDGNPRWSELCGIRTVDELSTLVKRECDANAMRTDDISLLHLGFKLTDCDELSDT